MPSERFTVFIYENEIEYLKWLVVQRENIETGGDLFGLWTTANTAVVQLLLGPGKNCSRSHTSFHQDVKYLDEVGQNLTKCEGLCNIGEWHSHHRIDLAKPSEGDQSTVWRNIKIVAGGRFIVFIANITGSTSIPVIKVGCFLFNSATKEMSQGSLKYLPDSSPLRLSLNEAYLAPGAEPQTDWKTFDVSSRETQERSPNRLQRTNDRLSSTAQLRHSDKTRKVYPEGEKKIQKSQEYENMDEGLSSKSRKLATKFKPLVKPRSYGTLNDEQDKQSGRSIHDRDTRSTIMKKRDQPRTQQSRNEQVITRQPTEKQYLLRDSTSPVPGEKEESGCACC